MMFSSSPGDWVVKARPAAFLDTDRAALVTTGNTADHLDLLARCALRSGVLSAPVGDGYLALVSSLIDSAEIGRVPSW